jgi:hypothetical protein
VIVFDVAVFPTKSVRITYTESEPEELNEVVYVDDVAPETAFPFRYHWYEYDGVPAVPLAVKVIEFPTSVGF